MARLVPAIHVVQLEKWKRFGAILRHLAAALDQIVTILALSTARRSKPRDGDSGKWAIY
jgi:hypothetical protein